MDLRVDEHSSACGRHGRRLRVSLLCGLGSEGHACANCAIDEAATGQHVAILPETAIFGVLVSGASCEAKLLMS
jgi:hypothetical protein